MPTSRAADKATDRQAFFNALRAAAGATKAIRTLSARFESFANTVQTRLDVSNGTGPTLTGSLEAQVDRALSQVLRQAPTNGYSPPGGYSAAAGQAPVGEYSAGGQTLTQPVTQALSMATWVGGLGGPPAIAPRQAALLQEATLVRGDMLSVLGMLQPLSTFADPSDLAAVTAVVRAEVNLLIEEFSRTSLRPRSQRVRVLLGGLLGFNPAKAPDPNPGDVGALITLLNLGGPIVPTLLVDQQLASQQVLTTDAAQLLSQWVTYQTQEPGIPPPWDPNLPAPRLAGGLGNLGPQPGVGKTLALGPPSAQAQFRIAVIRPGNPSQQPSPSYAERLIQADLLLPVVGQDASRVAGALDAIGLSQGEQETTFITLQSLVDADLLGSRPTPPAPPNANSVIQLRSTVTDILDWTASMADAKALDLLRQAGQLGLNLIADQADELFWLVAALLQPKVPAGSPPGTLPAPQEQMIELGDAQVQTELFTLARDLNLLANLAV